MAWRSIIKSDDIVVITPMQFVVPLELFEAEFDVWLQFVEGRADRVIRIIRGDGEDLILMSSHLYDFMNSQR